MTSQSVAEIEARIAALPPDDQLRLLEDLARRLRARLAGTGQSETASFGDQLAVMACDGDIRAELNAIDVSGT